MSAGGILVALYVLSEFGAVAMLRYDTLTPLVYVQYTTRFDRSSAAVLALPLLALGVVFLLIDALTRGRARYHARGLQRPAGTLQLGRWRWPALLLCSLVVTFGLGIPVAVVLYWVVKGLSEGSTTGLVTEAVLNSARVSAFAAVTALAAALPVALLSVRHPGWLSGLLERAAYSGQALPAITIALALVFFTANYFNVFYQTLALLIFAYTVRFLPEALGASRTGLLQVNPNTEEAARSLGAGSWRTLVRVTIPQMLPGLTTGMLLVFLTVMKELPITLLLSPIGFDTLATEIWAATSEAFFTRAGLPALVLLALSAVAAFLMLRREQIA
jgi:iron(III) transport system permease protein